MKSVVLDFDISWGQYPQTRVTHSLSFCIPGIVPTRESVPADCLIPSNFWTERARLRQLVSVHRIFELIRRALLLEGKLSPFLPAGARRPSVTEGACRPFPTVEPPGLPKRSNLPQTSSSIYVRLGRRRTLVVLSVTLPVAWCESSPCHSGSLGGSPLGLPSLVSFLP